MKNSLSGIGKNLVRAAAIAALMTAAALLLLPAACSVPRTNSQVPRITAAQLKAKLDAGENVIVVDTRDKVFYDELHIPGAVSIPDTEVAARSSEVEGYDEIVTYCT